MRTRFALLPSLAIVLACAAFAQAETKVNVTGMHICCGGCANAIKKALGDVKGIKFEVDQDNESVSITAESDEAAQQAINALGKTGFSGKLDNEKVSYVAIEAPEGKVKRLELTGTHNCCGACTTAIKKTLKGVDGVTADTCKAKQTSFVVEGDFDAKAVIKALTDAGFYVQVKKS